MTFGDYSPNLVSRYHERKSAIFQNAFSVSPESVRTKIMMKIIKKEIDFFSFSFLFNYSSYEYDTIRMKESFPPKVKICIAEDKTMLKEKIIFLFFIIDL